eukprot:1142332-Prymnesium_polylepis.1
MRCATLSGIEIDDWRLKAPEDDGRCEIFRAVGEKLRAAVTEGREVNGREDCRRGESEALLSSSARDEPRRLALGGLGVDGVSVSCTRALSALVAPPTRAPPVEAAGGIILSKLG